MKLFVTVKLLGILFVSSAVASAAKIGAPVTPDSLEAHGFSMKVENQKDGTVGFTLIRDLSKAKSFPADSGLRISRYATLKVSDKSGLRVRCEIAPNTRQQGTIIYRFTIARDCVDHSSFDLAENDDYQDQTRERLIGGGTHYSFALVLFAKHGTADKRHTP